MQSLKPYKGSVSKEVAIFGLDTEYLSREGEHPDLLTWQLASDYEVSVNTHEMTIATVFAEAERQLHQRYFSTYVFVTFFSIAEIQFFNLDDWVIDEFKGKYKLTQTYRGKKMMVVDLADWYQKMKLEAVAEQWGEKKLDYDIGLHTTEVMEGKRTRENLLKDPEFIDYAKNDAVITQRIYKKMRDYFIKDFEVDIVSTMTPANTSASIFRKDYLKEVIGQRDTELRAMAIKCCWGGRMEAVYRGEKPKVYEYDATGHHPNSAIALEKLPLENNWVKTTDVRRWVSGISGVGRVYFKFPEDEVYPCLPVFHRDCLLFPLEGESYCTVSEARQALAQGAKITLFLGFYYKDGTDILTRYLRRMQEIRNSIKDPAYRNLLKLLCNSVIGKLFQKNIGTDLAAVQKYALEKQIPYEEALKLEGIEFSKDAGTISVGACFYPEWYSLILGYARANIAKNARDHHALVISSDSFVTEEKLQDPFESQKISYSKKAEGYLVCYRTRFYRVGVKLAHHAVHSLDASKKVLRYFHKRDTYAYKFYRFLRLKESWKKKKPFGARVMMPMTAGLGYDWKRCLLEDNSGWSRPWKNIEEREEALGMKKLSADSPERNRREETLLIKKIKEDAKNGRK